MDKNNTEGLMKNTFNHFFALGDKKKKFILDINVNRKMVKNQKEIMN